MKTGDRVTLTSIVRSDAGNSRHFVDSCPGRRSADSSLKPKIGAQLLLEGEVALPSADDRVAVGLDDGRRLRCAPTP